MEVDFGRIFGNEALLDTLKKRVRTGTAAHAYLMEGPAGSGKRTLAVNLAAALCCEDENRVPCGHCIFCRKIFARPVQSPDVTVLGLEDEGSADDAKKSGAKTKSIGVAEIRTLKNDAYIRPNDLERKIYIIGHADRMTAQAQNALLKILEEPPEAVMFFLLCENRAALLPTVRSRVQMLTMERFTDDRPHSPLITHEQQAPTLHTRAPDKPALFVRLAGGAYGRALYYLGANAKQLSQDPAYDAHSGAEACLACVFAGGDGTGNALLGESVRSTRTELFLLLGVWGDTRERLRGLLDALSAAVRDLTMCAKGCEGTLLFYPHTEQPEELSARCSTYSLMQLSVTLAALRERLDSNPNVTLVQSETAMALYRLQNGS
ncbi:MAG: hypothetical protein MJ175_12835 [Clostridia bacterium]|nr:hypothetical protein [Clostridia bacterium]